MLRMNRTAFLVDGLNLYHSLEEASRDSGGAPFRWLDIRSLLDCLQADGIALILGRFKPKFVHCNLCGRLSEHHEEKETDVAVSVELLEVLHRDEADTIAIVTGDTDIAPALRTARRLFPAKRIWLVLPYKRRNNELARLADGYCYIRKERYAQHQWPPTMRLPSGRVVVRPQGW